MNTIKNVISVGLVLSTSIATANQITQCVQDAREAAINHQQVKRNPLTYLAIAGAAGPAVVKGKTGWNSILTGDEMQAIADQKDAKRRQEQLAARVAEYRKKLTIPSKTAEVSTDPKFQAMLEYVSKEFQLQYERTLLTEEMRGVAKEVIRETPQLKNVPAEKALATLTPKPGVTEAEYIRGVRSGFGSTATIETIRDMYRKSLILEAAIAQNVNDMEMHRLYGQHSSYREIVGHVGVNAQDYNRAKQAGGSSEKADEIHKKTLEQALELEKKRIPQPWEGGDVFDRMRAASLTKGATAVGGVLAATGIAMGVTVKTAQAQCGTDLSRDEAAHLVPFVQASVAGGCRLSDMGAEALVLLPDAEVEKLCQQIPSLPHVLAKADLEMMDKLAGLPKFTKVEPNCATSSLNVEVANGRKYQIKVASAGGGNFDISGTATGAVQRVIDFNGKLKADSMDFMSLKSKQRNAGASIDPKQETPEAIINSYFNSARLNQDSSSESKTIMGEGATLAKAFVPLLNAHCGTSGGGSGEPATTSN